MRVWIDALTSKQATLFAHLARELKARGYEVLVTCRKYEYTEGALKRLGIEPIVIGKYAEGSPYDKVLADIERMTKLLSIVRKFKPDLLLAYPNPPAARVAFGVGVNYIAITDSPHSEVPSRLSLPLATAVIFSKCIPKAEIITYTYVKTRLYQYRGVDEVAWIFRSRPDIKYLRTLALEPFNYIVVRPHEHLATYYRGYRAQVNLEKIIKVLSNEGFTIVFLPRYKVHELLANKLMGDGISVKVINEAYDGVSLTYYALAVISGGASMAREASLLGTPGISYYPGRLYVNECIKLLGFPLYTVGSDDEVIEIIKSLDRDVIKRKSFSDIIDKLRRNFEDPVKVIIDVINKVST